MTDISKLSIKEITEMAEKYMKNNEYMRKAMAEYYQRKKAKKNAEKETQGITVEVKLGNHGRRGKGHLRLEGETEEQYKRRQANNEKAMNRYYKKIQAKADAEGLTLEEYRAKQNEIRYKNLSVLLTKN